MGQQFLGLSQEERNNILDKHKNIYNGYSVKQNVSNVQPLYVQDFANDKEGITVNNKGEVSTYKNVGINESEDNEQYEKVDYLGTEHKKKSNKTKNYLSKNKLSTIMNNLESESEFNEDVDSIKESVLESLKWFKKIIK